MPVGQLNFTVSPSHPDDRMGCDISCNGFVSVLGGGTVTPGGITTVTVGSPAGGGVNGEDGGVNGDDNGGVNGDDNGGVIVDGTGAADDGVDADDLPRSITALTMIIIMIQTATASTPAIILNLETII